MDTTWSTRSSEPEDWLVGYERRSDRHAVKHAGVVTAWSAKEAAEIALEGEYTEDGNYTVYVVRIADLNPCIVTRTSNINVEATCLVSGISL